MLTIAPAGAVAHATRGLPPDDERADEIDLEHPPHEGGRRLEKGDVLADARRVHEPRQRAEGQLAGLDRPPDSLLVGDVEALEACALAEGGERLAGSDPAGADHGPRRPRTTPPPAPRGAIASPIPEAPPVMKIVCRSSMGASLEPGVAGSRSGQRARTLALKSLLAAGGETG